MTLNKNSSDLSCVAIGEDRTFGKCHRACGPRAVDVKITRPDSNEGA